MPITRKGIYHNLDESKYVVSNDDMTFYFSSKYYLRRFLSTYKDERNKLRKSFERYDIMMNYELLSDISLYNRIEKRGYKCVAKGVKLSCQETYLYALAKTINKTTNDWYETQRLK